MRLKKDLTVHRMGDEHIVLLHGSHGVDTTKIVSLNTTALWLWNRFAGEGDFTLAHVAGALRDEFDLECTMAAHDAQAWVDTLIQNDLIEQ